MEMISGEPVPREYLSSRLCEPEIAKLRENYQLQDEFIHLPDAIAASVVNTLQGEAARLKPVLHRNYVPSVKKGGSIGYRTLRQQNSPVLDLYKSAELLSLIEKLTGRRLLVCPESDAHACALYYYTEKGDHIHWHYDSSFYKGERFTLLLPLKDTTSIDSCHLDYQLYTRLPNRAPESHSAKLPVGSMTLFNGDRLWHTVTPKKDEQGERIIVSMEFVTTQEIGLIGMCINNVKDAVTYFGVSALLPESWTSTFPRRPPPVSLSLCLSVINEPLASSTAKLLPAPARKAIAKAPPAKVH